LPSTLKPARSNVQQGVAAAHCSLTVDGGGQKTAVQNSQDVIVRAISLFSWPNDFRVIVCFSSNFHRQDADATAEARKWGHARRE